MFEKGYVRGARRRRGVAYVMWTLWIFVVVLVIMMTTMMMIRHDYLQDDDDSGIYEMVMMKETMFRIVVVVVVVPWKLDSSYNVLLPIPMNCSSFCGGGGSCGGRLDHDHMDHEDEDDFS